jgi:hypothetical protein
MRMLKFVFPLFLFAAAASVSQAAEKNMKPDTEKPTEQTGTLSGSIQPPEKEAPQGAIASLHQAGANKGEESITYLFAEGSLAKQLKELANKGGSATVAGTITKNGYRVTSISNVVKQKK